MKSTIKNRILTFIIGLLSGSIITILGFMIYLKGMQDEMSKPQMNDGMFKPNSQMGNPPEKPDDKMPIELPQGMQNYYKK